ncbi:hypothetical protein Vadar_001373 [Vaccinium darrowii]|uniref:Uncharacterized protein n=1 Tax=Vaccinium darrowii TaxID=229202 RepID=A0ACB7Y5T0_9ERIC|nr:hypothetical protein Vadar_001373 [Vaccinium darrowii]
MIQVVTYRYFQRYNIGMEMDMPFLLWPDERSILPGLLMGISSHVVRDASFWREIDYIIHKQHPIVGVFSGYGKDFSSYSGGLYRGLPNGRDDRKILHSVLITDAGEHYYEIMNSAGPSWGIRGVGYVCKSLFVEFSYPLEAPFLVGDDV